MSDPGVGNHHDDLHLYLHRWTGNHRHGGLITSIVFLVVAVLLVVYSRSMKKNGVLVVETVNPHCFEAFKLFHLDPTHRNPLYPEFVQFLCRTSGFKDPEILYLTTDGFSKDLYAECGDYAVICAKAATENDGIQE